MSYRKKVSKKDRIKWINKIDELLDIEFEKTVNKIKNDIEEKAVSAIKKIKAGKIKKAEFIVKAYVNFTYPANNTLPTIMNDELTFAYYEASGDFSGDLMNFNNYSKKYDIFAISSEDYGIRFYSFQFYKKNSDESIFPFRTKTGKNFCNTLRLFFEEKNIKLKFKHDGLVDCMTIMVKCDKNSII